MSDALYLSNVRLSFPKLIEATAAQGQPNSPKKFGADLIMPPNHPDFARVMEAIGKLASDKWKEQAPQVLQMIQNDRRLRCWGNGSEKIKKLTMKPYEGYQDMVYFTTSMNEDRPPVMVRSEDGKPVDNANTMERTALARKLYGGCYVNAMVSLWIQDNQYGRGIRMNLNAVQFLRDGEAFGDAAPDVEGVFGAVQGAQAPAMPTGFPSFFQ